MVLFTVLAVALAIGIIVVIMGINEGYRADLISNLVDAILTLLLAQRRTKIISPSTGQFHPLFRNIRR